MIARKGAGSEVATAEEPRDRAARICLWGMALRRNAATDLRHGVEGFLGVFTL